MSLNASSALILYYGSNFNIFLIKNFASLDISFHSGPAITYLPVFILSKISFYVLPLKGGYPHNIT